jgi:TfoX/Sxy family transcriptional regulator of competence genes
VAFDEGLAERIRDVLIKTPRISERRMFGGVAFLADGHMCVGVIGDLLMARVGPENYAAALKRAHVREIGVSA